MALERLEFYIGSTADLTISNLKRKDVKPAVLVTDAVVNAVMNDAADSPVTGVTNPIVMAAVSGFDGRYQGTVNGEDASGLAVGATGEFIITAVSPTSGTRVFYIPYEVKKG